jgi:hypothetical protein
MIPLTPEQREYKERTLNQLLVNQSLLESRLTQENRPDVIQSIMEQLQDIEAHLSRLQDELAGDVVFDEPVADDLFKQAAKALASQKFFLAKKHIHRLETIEPFYPGIERLKHEAETERVSRRTRSIAQGQATSYPGRPILPPKSAPSPSPQPPTPEIYTSHSEEAPRSWWSHLFQLHIILSCLVVLLLICVMFGVGGFTVLEWFIEGG